MKTVSSRKQNEDPVIKKTIGDSMEQIIQYLRNELQNSVELGQADGKKRELTEAISLCINQLQRMELISISTQTRKKSIEQL